jgi:hypothetical protein
MRIVPPLPPLLASLWLGLILVGTVHASEVTPPVGVLPTTVFLDDAEFRLAARKAHLDVAAFDITPATIVLAQHQPEEVKETTKLVQLPRTLSFEAHRTGLPLSFTLSKVTNTAASGQSGEKADGFVFVKSDTTGHQWSDLHVAVRPEDDDFRVDFETVNHHESVPYQYVTLHLLFSSLLTFLYLFVMLAPRLIQASLRLWLPVVWESQECAREFETVRPFGLLRMNYALSAVY